MITHCAKCKINWASLWTDTNDGDETISFCPQCGTDMHLQPGNDITGFIKCPFSGKITNVDTGEELETKPPAAPYKKKVKVFDETFEEWCIRREQAEDAGIAVGTFSEVEMPQRRFHFEEVTIL